MIGKTNAVLAGASPAETVIIRLEANGLFQSVVQAASVTMLFGQESETLVYPGEEIVREVPSGVECEVQFGNIEGYRTPDPVRFVSVQGNTRRIVGLYEACRLTIGVAADAGNVFGHEILIEEHEVVGVYNRYDRLEYIESNGTQYIDTGYKPNHTTRVVMDILHGGTDMTVLFGNQSGQTNVGVMASPTNVYYNYGGDLYLVTNPKPGERVTVDADRNVLTYGGVSVQAPAVEFQSEKTIFLLVSNFTDGGSVDSTWTSALIYSCRIYEDDVLVRDYIPAMGSDRVPGLYEAVSDRFYPSATESPFIAGDIVRRTVYRQTLSEATYDIPYGKRIRITASDVDGFITPAPVVFDVQDESRTEYMVYIQGRLNVWIATYSGRLVNPDHWDYTAGETPVGVAVVTENSAFIVNDRCYSLPWNEDYPTTLLPGVPVPSESDLDAGIYYHYDGTAYTDTMATYGDQYSWDAANVSKRYCSVAFGGREIPGYVGSTGEWADLGDNYGKVEEALSRIGMEFRPSGMGRINGFWTSCQKDNDQAYAMTYYPEMYEEFTWWFAYPEKSNPQDNNALKPFFKI